MCKCTAFVLHVLFAVCDCCRCSYPPSLFRIISSLRLFIGISGLQQFLDSDTVWRYKFPTTLIDLERDPPPGLSARPNVFFFGDPKGVINRLKQFAFFKPLILLQTPINHQVIKV
jgi:hypothetical protein